MLNYNTSTGWSGRLDTRNFNIEVQQNGMAETLISHRITVSNKRSLFTFSHNMICTKDAKVNDIITGIDEMLSDFRHYKHEVLKYTE